MRFYFQRNCFDPSLIFLDAFADYLLLTWQYEICDMTNSAYLFHYIDIEVSIDVSYDERFSMTIFL